MSAERKKADYVTFSIMIEAEHTTFDLPVTECRLKRSSAHQWIMVCKSGHRSGVGKYWGFDLTHGNEFPPRTSHQTGHRQERRTLHCHTLRTLICLFHELAMPERMTRDRTPGY